MNLTKKLRWQSAVSFGLAIRLAFLTIVPVPNLVRAAETASAPVLTVASAADQWLGETTSGYNLTVTPSRQQVEERAAIPRERVAALPAPQVEILSRERVEALIDQFAAQYHVSAPTMRNIIRCESGYNQKAKNRRSSAAGFAQFLDGTWKSALRSLGYNLAISQYDGEKNLEALAYVLSTQGTRPWNASKACWSR